MTDYTYFMHCTDEDLRRKSLDAWAHLESQFSEYRKPSLVDHCPCGCITDYDVKRFNEGYLGKYMGKAMTTWGGVDDFGYYLPQVLRYFFEEDSICAFIVCDRIKMFNPSFEQKVAIFRYAVSKSREIVAKSVREQIAKIRVEVSEWLKNPESAVCINTYHPFEILCKKWTPSDSLYCSYAHFFSFSHVVELKRLLHYWPMNALDLFACAHFMGDAHHEPRLIGELFRSEIEDWVDRCKRAMTQLLAQTKEEHARNILLEAIQREDWSIKKQICDFVEQDEDLLLHEDWCGFKFFNVEERRALLGL